MAIEYLRQYAKQPAVPVSPSSVRPGRFGIEQLIAGEILGEGRETCFVTETVWDGSHKHGMHALQDIHGVSAAQLSLVTRDPELQYAPLTQAVFLDTETTGLSTGTGTYVFLVGAGYFDGSAFRVRQFFLQSPGEERPFLDALRTFLSEFAMLVTFNGKAFDWPLLEARFIRHRAFRASPMLDPPHVDLLHSARRLWKRRLPSCALTSLEQNVLGVERSGEDVPGWLIPSLYFQYLRTGDGRELKRVFYHNAIDILSLATLAIHVSRVLADPLGALNQHGVDVLCIGKLFERSGDWDTACSCFEEALRRELLADERAEALMRLATLYRRDRRWEAALGAWDQLVDSGGGASLHGLIERAKYYEHVERDYLEALDDVQRALRLCDLVQASTGSTRIELEHRQARLVNRAYRHRSWSEYER
jgi:uncharacterized protein YprB with RNaseH-like and TPR domain